jgi:SAM-dependent methyltransferase
MKLEKYIYSRFENTLKYKNELINFLKNSCNAEVGGNKIFDGYRTHATQNPYEIVDLIFSLKEYEKNKSFKFNSFLEVGFSSGITNTLLNKFFNFNNIVGIDLFKYSIDANVLHANMLNKNLTLICSDTTELNTINKCKKNGPYDLIFIDADHSYEGLKKDFNNYKKLLTQNGVIAFHDIRNPDWPGVSKLWLEILETKKYEMKEFFCDDFPIKYGIGILWLK